MIERFTLGMDFDAYRDDFKTMAAVERKLLLISEAAVQLGDEGPALCESSRRCPAGSACVIRVSTGAFEWIEGFQRDPAASTTKPPIDCDVARSRGTRVDLVDRL